MANLRGTFLFEDVHIRYKNFSGKGSDFNPEGRRNFCLDLDPETAERMREDGWNVKHKEIDNGDGTVTPLDYIKVMVSYKFEESAPKVFRISGDNMVQLTEKTIGSLDWEEIEHIDLQITPSNWTRNNGALTGVTAYLKSMYVTVHEDELAKKYSMYNRQDSVAADEVPFDETVARMHMRALEDEAPY